MRASNETPTGAFYGFIKILKKTVEKHQIDAIIIFNDSQESSRKKINPGYKSNRDKTPDELQTQKEMLFELLHLINIPIVTVAGFEADDLIYSAASLCSNQEKGIVFILSSDKDLHRLLLLKNTFIIDMNKETILDKEWLKTAYIKEINEEKISLYYALCGDTSDNIQGVKGIGEKTAKKIIQIYNSLDEAYENQFEKSGLTPRLRNLLLSKKADAYLAQDLFNPLFVPPSYFEAHLEKKWKKEFWGLGNSLLKKYECLSLLTREEISNTTVEQEVSSALPFAKDMYTVKTASNQDDIHEIENSINTHDFLALDTETDAGNPMKATMIGFSLSFEKESAWYIPLYEKGVKSCFYEQKIELLLLICKKNKKVIMHNALFDMHIIQRTIGEAPQSIFDTMIAAHIFREQKIGLKELSIKILKEKMQTFSEIMQFGKYKTFDEVELSIAASYAATDARQTLCLFLHYQSLLKKEEFNSYNLLFDTVEMPLIPVLQSIESNGIFCDGSILIAQEKAYKDKMTEIRTAIDLFTAPYNIILNPASYKQTSYLLFEVLKIPTQQKLRTDQKTLSRLAFEYEIIDLILRYRSIQNNITHFSSGLLKYIQEDRKIYTHYQQFITVTGRLTTMNPNLQNIPRTTEHIFIRSAFHADKNHVLVSFDYSQIELRIAAYLAQDETLLSLFNKNQDVHLLTATALFKKSLEEITGAERQIAKKINFSILYGQSAFSLSKELHITTTAAHEYIELYKGYYPGIFSWMEKIKDAAKKTGYVETLYGLKRYIPELKDKNKTVLKSGERMAVNTVIQGTAAEIMKKSMIAVYSYLEKEKKGKIVLQLHDEILVEIPEKYKETVPHEIQKIMESIVNWSVILKVNTRIGREWK